MMLDWNTYRKQLADRLGEIGKASPDIVRGYAQLSHAERRAGTWMRRPAS
jgi:hypothetical protein